MPIGSITKKLIEQGSKGKNSLNETVNTDNRIASRNAYEVVVIGAGIAGSIAARLLAKKGISVLLVEKDRFSGKNTACGGLFDRPYFDRYVDDTTIIEQEIRKNIFHLPWGDVVYDCNQITVKRRVYDRYLAGKAQKAGAELVNLVKATDFTIEAPGRTTVTLQAVPSGQHQKVQAKLILFADGPRSLAFKNPLFKKQVRKKYWAYAYAYEVEGLPVSSEEVHIYFAPQLFPWGYGWIFPNKKESNVGVGTLLSQKESNALKKKLFYFLNEFPATGSLLSGRAIKDKKGGFIPMWLYDRLSDDSQLLLGDAGGMVSPLFGAGIDYAIDAAEAAAQTVSEALRQNRFSADFLQRYDQRINERFGKDLRKQMLLTRIILMSRRFGKLWPVKILTVIAFGAKYSRWNKIRILAYPFLGKPKPLAQDRHKLDHK